MTADPSTTVATRGFRPGSRRRARIAAGVTVAALAVGGNALVYSTLDDSTEVVQFTTNVAAGDLITAADVRVVDVDADMDTTNLVPAEQLGSIVDRYARTFIPSGSLASTYLVRSTPLVSPGSAIVAISPVGDRLPSGLVERSRVWLVIDAGPTPTTIEGRVVADDRDRGELSVEVAEVDAPAVAAADDVHVVLLDPGTDPASEGGG